MDNFDKIIGYTSIKNELRQIADILKNPENYEPLGVLPPVGLLLDGDPGVGKTLMATCLINESGRKAFICRKDRPDGVFTSHIKEVFDKAVKEQPSIVFLDDMDKFTNGDNHHRDAEEYVTVQSCIDSIKGADVFILATTNNLDCLPRSLLRAGRFDRIIKVDNPRGADAVKIVDHYLKKKKFVGDIDPVFVARIMDGKSCAELETLINDAGMYAGFERSNIITMDHIMHATLRNLFEKEPDNDYDDYDEDIIKELNANETNVIPETVYHEAGHVLVSEVLFPGSVTFATILSRNGGGGITNCYSGTGIMTLEDRKKRIIVDLAGMAATEQKFGTYDSGSARDLSAAFNRTQQLVGDNVICGFSCYDFGYESTTKQKEKIESATISEIEKYYKIAKELISKNNDFFEQIANILFKKGTITSLDITEIKNKTKIIAVAA